MHYPPTRKQIEGASKEESSITTSNKKLYNEIFKRIQSWVIQNIANNAHPPRVPHLWAEFRRGTFLAIKDYVVKKTTQEILGQSGAISSVEENIVDSRTWDDLDLFQGNEPLSESCLTNKISRCSTEIGRLYLMGLLSSPTTNANTLRSRQLLIQKLNNHGFAARFTKILQDEKVKKGEGHLSGFWQSGDGTSDYFNLMFYHSYPKIAEIANESSLALEASVDYDHLKQLASLSKAALFALTFPAYALATLTGLFPNSSFDSLIGKLMSTNGVSYAIATHLNSPWITGITALMATSLMYAQAKEKLAWLKANLEMDRALHEKMYPIAVYYKAIKQIYLELSENKDISDLFEHFSKLKEFFEDKTLSKIFNILDSSTLEGDVTGVFYQRGNLWYLFNQFTKPEVLKKFEPAITAFGEIDAFISTANLVKEFERKKVKFCYPKYLEKRKPEIHIASFWNIFIDIEKVVSNSLTFNPDLNNIDPALDNKIRCHIITGPNGGGKTTVLRSIIASTLIAQSLGIAPAESMTLTPFKYLASSMNITDAQGKSLFEAQCDRISLIWRKIEALKQAEFSLVAIDEIFSATAHEEASQLARSYLKSFVGNENLLTLVVSHDRDITSVEETDKGSKFKNFQMSTEPPFQLLEGISEDSRAFIAAERCGVDKDIIEDAIKGKKHSK